MFTRPLRDIGSSDVANTGGKGASLGEMARVGLPIPPGFVVLAGAFERFLEKTDLNVEVDAILDTVNHQEMHTVEHASEKIQALILAEEIPKDIAQEIRLQFKILHSDYVAVRSSATAEDSASAAWAGQLDSFLNTTEKDLLKNAQKCWASLFTPRAIFYRFEKDCTNSISAWLSWCRKWLSRSLRHSLFGASGYRKTKSNDTEAGFGLASDCRPLPRQLCR